MSLAKRAAPPKKKAKGLAEEYTIFQTDFGPSAIAWSERGVTAFFLPEANEKELVKRLDAHGALPHAGELPPSITAAIALLEKHLAGDAQDLRIIALDLARVPPFHAKAYVAAREVLSGSKATYGSLGESMGAKNAQRAIGQAMGRNPIPVIVPCHRVVGANWDPGGFSAHGGLTTKSKLLVLEERAAMGLPLSRVPFDTDRAVRELSAADAKLGQLIKRIGPPNLKARPALSVFEALAESIVYQQLHGKAAASIFARLRFAVQPFTAEQLHRTRDAALQKAGISAGKLAALRDLAARCISGDVPELAAMQTMKDADIVDRLTAIRGIGPWTVDMILMFRLGRPDILPIGDFGVKKGFGVTFGKGEMPDDETVIKRAERWRPWRSLASWYMWRAADENAAS